MSKEAKKERLQSFGFVALLVSLTTIVMSMLAVSAEDYSEVQAQETRTQFDSNVEIRHIPVAFEKVFSIYPDWYLEFNENVAKDVSTQLAQLADDLERIRESK